MGIRRASTVWALLLGSVMLMGCQQPQAARVELAPDEKLQIVRAVWDEFEIYKTKLISEGAFVVSETGDGAGYTVCPAFRCQPTNYVRRAIDLCEKAGVKCVLFAAGWEILVDYEIVD